MEDIAVRLRQDEPVILNTGRSISWVQTRIIARLYHAHNLRDRGAMRNLLVVGEKGGTWLTFDDEGLMHEHIDDSISVPQDLQDEIRRIVEERFSKTMFFDKTKRTMITIEMNEINDKRFDGDLTLEAFARNQKELVETLKELLERRNLTQDLSIDPTTIATDVQNRHVGKDIAVGKAFVWLRSRGVKAEKFIAVGDSISDIPMAEELQISGEKVEFVFVGKEQDKKTIQAQNHAFPIHFTKGEFNKGILEFLRSQS